MICKEGTLRKPVISWLESLGMSPVFEVYYCDVVGAQWAERIDRRIPALLRVVGVELKMDDVSGVIRQCQSNRHRYRECFAAMPSERISRMSNSTLNKFRRDGIGLLSVLGNICSCVIMPISNLDVVSHDHLKSNLWRRRDEWRGRVDCTRARQLQRAKSPK